MDYQLQEFEYALFRGATEDQALEYANDDQYDDQEHEFEMNQATAYFREDQCG